MADTCFLCTMGANQVLLGGPAPGEGFGTCYDCSVHACPRHGDRNLQHFRCAECIAAMGAESALTEPAERRAEKLLGETPRLSVLSAGLRKDFDFGRMGAAVGWIHRRARENDVLLPAADNGIDRRDGAALALGFSSEEEVEPAAAAEELELRAQLVEEQIRSIAREASLDSEEWDEEQRAGAGEIAAVSLAIAYDARGAITAEKSPFELSGGLMLPAPVVVLGHAYAVANHFFW